MSDGLDDRGLHLLAAERTARVVVMGAERAPSALVALHGYGQRADLFARHLAPHAGADRRVVVPEALSRFYLDVPTPDVVRHAPVRRHVGASWATRLARDADVADHIAYLDRAATAFVPDGAAAAGLGFSQGAAMLCRWATAGAWTAARPLGRLVLWGGLVPDDVLARVTAAEARLPPVVLVTGDADGYLAPDAVAAHAARLADLGVAVERHAFAGGHRLDAPTLATVLGASDRGG